MISKLPTVDIKRMKNKTDQEENHTDRTASAITQPGGMIVQFENKKTCFKKHPLRELEFEPKWKLCSCHYPKEMVSSIFQICQTVDATHVWLHWNKQPKMIKEIQNTTFPKLQMINFGGNQITNLQALASVDMPNLKQLFLWHNFIVDISSLRKAELKQLKILDLSGNFIKKAIPMNESAFTKSITKFNIDDNKFYEINDFVPIIATKQIPMDLINNKFIHIRQHQKKKGKKQISTYTYTKNQMKYF